MSNIDVSSLAEAPIVGITATVYPNLEDVRFEVSLQLAESWRDIGLPLIVVDGSPTGEDGVELAKDAYRQRGAIVLATEVPGIASQRQQGVRFAHGAGAKKFLTHEPEKPAVPAIAGKVAGLLETADIIVVGRTEKAKQTMPPVQLRTEQLAGIILERTLQLPPDALAGPRGYSRLGIEHLLRYPSQLPVMNNWIYMYDNLLEARNVGQRVAGMEADLLYPARMVAQETGNGLFDAKRYHQFKIQLEYLLKRPEVDPIATVMASFVLNELSKLGSDFTNAQFEATLTCIENFIVQNS